MPIEETRRVSRRRWTRSLALVVVLGATCGWGAMACSGPAAMSPPLATDAGAEASAPDAGAPNASDAGTTMDAAASSDAASSDAAPPDAAAPTPTLAALSVSGSAAADASAQLTLIPPFSPDVHDYVVRCAEGTNELSVSMAAADGSTSLLVQPTPSPSLPQQTLVASVNENQAIVAAATNGTATAEYWVRCLPHDFPQLQWTPHPGAGTPAPGYYLVGTSVPTTSGCYAMVLDRNGVPVWYAREQPGGGLVRLRRRQCGPRRGVFRLADRQPVGLRDSSARPAGDDARRADRREHGPPRASRAAQRQLPGHLQSAAARRSTSPGCRCRSPTGAPRR